MIFQRLSEYKNKNFGFSRHIEACLWIINNNKTGLKGLFNSTCRFLAEDKWLMVCNINFISSKKFHLEREEEGVENGGKQKTEVRMYLVESLTHGKSMSCTFWFNLLCSRMQRLLAYRQGFWPIKPSTQSLKIFSSLLFDFMSSCSLLPLLSYSLSSFSRRIKTNK